MGAKRIGAGRLEKQRVLMTSMTCVRRSPIARLISQASEPFGSHCRQLAHFAAPAEAEVKLMQADWPAHVQSFSASAASLLASGGRRPAY